VPDYVQRPRIGDWVVFGLILFNQNNKQFDKLLLRRGRLFQGGQPFEESNKFSVLLLHVNYLWLRFLEKGSVINRECVHVLHAPF